MWVGGVDFNFAAQAIDVGVYGMAVSFVAVSPNFIEELFPAVGFSGIGTKQKQKIIFLAGQIDGFTG